MSTEYVVFENSDERGWRPIGGQEARSAESAIRLMLDRLTQAHDLSGLPHEGDHPLQYAAVPARSWRPVTVKVETKTALKFS